MDDIRVLLVDDSPTFLRAAAAFLATQEGIRVAGTATGAEEALAALARQPVEVVVLDLAMPGVSGLDALPRLRAAAPGVGVVVVTLSDADAYRRAALEAGADEFVPKSDLARALVPAIRRAVRPAGPATAATPLGVLVIAREATVSAALAALGSAGFVPHARVEAGLPADRGLDPAPDVVLVEDGAGGPEPDDLRPALGAGGRETPVIVLLAPERERRGARWLEAGAADWVFTDRLARLGPAVRAALEGRRLRAELRALARRHRLVTENVHDAIFMVDLEGRLVFANARLAELTGYALDEAASLPLFAFLTPESAAVAQARLAALRAGEPVLPLFEVEVRRPDGSVRVIEVSFASVMEQGRLVGRMGVARDVTERRQARQELDRRRREAEVLADLAREIGATLDLDVVLRRVVGAARELCRSDMARIALRDPESETFRMRHWIGPIAPGWESTVIERGRGLGGLVLASGRPARTGDYAADPAVSADYLPLARQEEVRSALAVPIGAPEAPDGLLFVVNQRPRPFTDADEAVLTRLAHHATVAIANARLYEAAGTRAGRLQALARLNALVSSSLDRNQVLSGIARAAAELMDAPLVTVWVAAEDERLLRLAGVSDEILGAGYPARALPFASSVAGQVAAEGRALNLADVEHWEGFVGLDWWRRQGLRSLLAVPIRSGESTLGVLGLSGREPFRLDAEGQELLDGFVAQAAAAIRNADLFAEATRRRQVAERLAQVGRALSESLDPARVAQSVVDSVLELLGVATAVLWQLDPESGELALLARAGDMGTEYRPGVRLAPGVGGVGRALREGHAVYISDVLDETQVVLNDQVAAMARRLPHRSLLAVPLTARGRQIGALGMNDRPGRRFTDEEVATVQLFADQAAAAIDNAGLYMDALHENARRERAEATLRAISERLAATIAASPLAIVEYDAQLRVNLWNPAAERLFGWSAAEALGQSLPPAPPEAGEQLRQVRARVLAGEALSGVEMVRYRRDGQPLDVAVWAAPIRDGQGPVSRAVVVIEDTSERRRMQEALLQSEKLSAMGALLAGLAHELNNPLSVVIGRSQMLVQQLAGATGAGQAEQILRAAERCARIVGNFLALARQRPPERGRVLLNDVVREALELLAYPLRVDGVAVDLRLDPTLPDLWADAGQLHQVVINLLTNAHQAVRQAGGPRQLLVTTGPEAGGTRVRLEVADTGPGVPPAIEARIFEPFFTTKPPGQGTGLGLSLCQALVEAHGGTIALDRRPARGAVFVVELPAAPGELAERERGAAGPPALVEGRAILVVDDETDILEMLAEVLGAQGLEVDTASDGQRALDLMAGRQYDVVLSDLRMPGMEGQRLHAEVARRWPGRERRFVFMTGDVLTEENRTFLEQVGPLTLEKPFSMDALARAVSQVLRGAG